MPIYEYRCQNCSGKHEVIQKFSDDPLVVCPDCGGELNKIISSTSFVLKGSGWYSDGYSSTAPAQKPANAPEKKSSADKKATTPSAK